MGKGGNCPYKVSITGRAHREWNFGQDEGPRQGGGSRGQRKDEIRELEGESLEEKQEGVGRNLGKLGAEKNSFP